jgi:hypothetical protein
MNYNTWQLKILSCILTRVPTNCIEVISKTSHIHLQMKVGRLLKEMHANSGCLIRLWTHHLSSLVTITPDCELAKRRPTIKLTFKHLSQKYLHVRDCWSPSSNKWWNLDWLFFCHIRLTRSGSHTPVFLKQFTSEPIRWKFDEVIFKEDEAWERS